MTPHQTPAPFAPIPIALRESCVVGRAECLADQLEDAGHPEAPWAKSIASMVGNAPHTTAVWLDEIERLEWLFEGMDV